MKDISKPHKLKLPTFRGQCLIRFAFMALAIISCSFLSSCLGPNAVCSSDPNTTINFKDLVMRSISMTSANEGWAVGTTSDRAYLKVSIHYKDGKWTPWPSVNSTNLLNIQMVSADEGYAAGWNGSIDHYKAGCWSQQRQSFAIESPAPELDGIYMVSNNEGWAVGYMGTILHYQNGGWSDASSPTHYSLSSVYMLSANDGWAVGGAILHYTGGQWTVVNDRVGGGLNSVYMVSKDEGWAVGGGEDRNGTPNISTILHYYNGKWETVTSPTSLPLYSVKMVSADEGWAVGGNVWSSGVIIHYKAGKWSVASIPASGVLYGLSMVSATEGWAVGRGTILHYQNGSWQQWQQLRKSARHNR